MGLLLDKLKQMELSTASSSTQTSNQNKSKNEKHNNQKTTSKKYQACVNFPDLDAMPPELSLQILKNLNATDLCLAACVWSSLANDDILWQGLCKSTWGYASCYKRKGKTIDKKQNGDLVSTNKDNVHQNSNNSFLTVNRSFRKIFMHLDEATLTFNCDWKKVHFINFLNI